MITAIHQPSYFPWLGWLDKINKCDQFILMDEVQLSDRAYQHRNIFLTNTGQEKFLTIGIQKKGYFLKKINELEINAEEPWQEKHLRFLDNNYRKHPYYNEVMQEVETIFTKKYTMLIEVLTDSINACLKLFKITTPVKLQSALAYNREMQKSDLILALLQSVGSTHYLSGKGAEAYMQLDDFSAKGIKVDFQEFTHPVYPQKNSANFIPGIACLDVLFNVGPQQATGLIHA